MNKIKAYREAVAYIAEHPGADNVETVFRAAVIAACLSETCKRRPGETAPALRLRQNRQQVARTRLIAAIRSSAPLNWRNINESADVTATCNILVGRRADN